MKEELADIEVIHKKSEDSISTSNPEIPLNCEKEITNVYIARKKTIFVLIESGDFLGKIAKAYMDLTADDIAVKNQLPQPDKLSIGQEIVLSNKVYVVEGGDSLGKIAKKEEFAPVEWEEIVKANELSNPNSIYVGQKLVIPLARTKHAKLCKEVKYVQVSDVSVGDIVHVVTETKGFKNGESITNTIKEDKNIVTQTDENLTVTKDDNETKEIIAINQTDKEDPTKGIAVSVELEIKPKLDVLMHTVSKGEVLGNIAKLYSEVTVDDIVEKNKLKDENSIYVGQNLIIPTDKMKEVITVQEVKDKLDKEPSKSTDIIPIASSPSLPKDDDVEGEEVKLTTQPKIVDVYFGTPVKSKSVKPSGTETYTFRSNNIITKENQKRIITKYIIPRTKKGDRTATYANAKKALPLGKYKKGSIITVNMSESVYSFKELKSSLSLFSKVYLVAEVKDFSSGDEIKLEILDKDGVLTSKGTAITFLDKDNMEMTSIEASVKQIDKKQFAVAEVKIERKEDIAKEVWKASMELTKNKKTHVRLKATPKPEKKCKLKFKMSRSKELFGGWEIAPWMKIAIAEAVLGKGKKESSSILYPMVQKYHKYVGWTFKTKKSCYKTAWCASFVSWTLNEAEYKNPKTVASRYYINHKTLKKIDTPIFGGIAVFSDCSKSGSVKSSGHVAFVYGTLPNERLALLGGNQGDRLKISSYDCSGNVFVSYKLRRKNKKTGKYFYKYFYKKLRDFYVPETYNICKSKKLTYYTSTKGANKALLSINIKENSNGESSR